MVGKMLMSTLAGRAPPPTFPTASHQRHSWLSAAAGKARRSWRLLHHADTNNQPAAGLVANQIAAGEVIERPANVVKELVENALDAGATMITVTIEDGGRRLVEVSDNGHGMTADDLRSALGRHATSKLAHADDLFCIGTLGFRGEALPSIASVSEMTLCSRPHDAGDASAPHLAAGTVIKQETASLNPGSKISVRNLFWNVPVRLKFLKPSRWKPPKSPTC